MPKNRYTPVDVLKASSHLTQKYATCEIHQQVKTTEKRWTDNWNWTDQQMNVRPTGLLTTKVITYMYLVMTVLKTVYSSAYETAISYFNSLLLELRWFLSIILRIPTSHDFWARWPITSFAFFSKQCLVESIQGKFQKNSSATLISEESP